MLVITALNDWGYSLGEQDTTRAAWEDLGENVRKVYSLHGADGNFVSALHTDGHCLLERHRRQAYEFLDCHLHPDR